jgi:hypothetical protein
MVVWSLLKSEDSQRVLYWLQSIQSRSPKASVMLVGTHADLANISKVFPFFGDVSFFFFVFHRGRGKKDYGNEVCAKYRARFPGLNIVGFTMFSPLIAGSLGMLLDNLDATTIAQPFIGEPVPTLYLALEAAVIAERKRVPPVLPWDEFQKIGVSCGLLREEELTRAVGLLHEMGSLFL